MLSRLAIAVLAMLAGCHQPAPKSTLVSQRGMAEAVHTIPVYTRGVGHDFLMDDSGALQEVADLVGNIGYSVHFYAPETLDATVALGVPINLTWSPYHREGHHPIDDQDGLLNFVNWCLDVFPKVAVAVPNPPAILLNTENLSPDEGSKMYHDLAYALAKRYWPDTPVYWYAWPWATWLFDNNKSDAVTCELYYPTDIPRTIGFYEGAAKDGNDRSLGVVAWVSLNSGYVFIDGVKTWVNPLEYDPVWDWILGRFLMAQGVTLEAVQLYPAPIGTESYRIHLNAFMAGFRGGRYEG